MIQHTRFVIAVPDLAVSAAYYRDVLGFTVHTIADPGWRFYTLGACTIMAGHSPESTPPAALGDHSYMAYWEVDAIDDYYATLCANGAKIVKPLRDEPWGMREFALQTVDGHRVMVGAAIAA
ncbi:MAG TPA: VOC family protein [Caldilineaceae bacterium]|nr:VOC family protein [Caldilineaceae bacterium]